MTDIIATHRCSPHTRGDGPPERARRELHWRFSPHAWGWSGPFNTVAHAATVLPTRVGMVRLSSRCWLSGPCSPHTRGDGPVWEIYRWKCGAFSPHAWGWSDINRPELHERRVLPTRVGMVRRPTPHRMRSLSSPHTRGDGPTTNCGSTLASLFSPHAWGWSARRWGAVMWEWVLPTRVGMVRR